MYRKYRTSTSKSENSIFYHFLSTAINHFIDTSWMTSSMNLKGRGAYMIQSTACRVCSIHSMHLFSGARQQGHVFFIVMGHNVRPSFVWIWIGWVVYSSREKEAEDKDFIFVCNSKCMVIFLVSLLSFSRFLLLFVCVALFLFSNNNIICTSIMTCK